MHYYERVYQVTILIPPGKVCTYGIIADFLALGSARMVGFALNKVHKLYPEVPAHRVVNRNGILTGKLKFATPNLMERLLVAEGIEIKEDQIINFTQHLWRPHDHYDPLEFI